MTFFSKLHMHYQAHYAKHPLRTMMIWSFLLPVTLLLIYYIAQGIFPFGTSTIFTVDLGQQYVDFYQYYRETLLGEWDGAAYSFEKAIGGEMMGTWSYYLLSPFLPLIVLFPQSWLSFAVALIVLLKIGTAGLAFQFMLGKIYQEADWRTLAFAVSYAMMGYMSVNQLNVMWLDGIAFLPLAIWGIEKITRGGSFLTYAVWLAVILAANYYIGYMICLFLVLYFIYALAKASVNWERPGAPGAGLVAAAAARPRFDWRQLWQSVFKFGFGSLTAGALAAIVLLPTVHALRGSKGAYTSPVFEWDLAYPLQDVSSKFIIGAFNFDQMPDGLPNLFIGTLGLVTAVIYFFQAQHPKRERLAALAITALLFLSMNVKGLNLIWHAFQYPIWYPYRYSFVLSFFLLFIGYRAYRQLTTIKLPLALGILAAAGLASAYLLLQLENFDYLSPWKIWVSLVVLVGMSVLLMLITDYRPLIFQVIAIVVIFEMTANSVLNLASLSYLNNSEFVNYITTVSPAIDRYRPGRDEFYRITKTFQRTKNDAMQLNYYDLNHFNSTLEKSTTQFFEVLGAPTSSGFVNYTTGTLLTDALFGVEYFIDTVKQPQTELDSDDIFNRRPTTYRADLIRYPIVQTDDNLMVHKNPHALPLGYMVPADVAGLDFTGKTPIILQDDLLNALTGQGELAQDYLTEFFTIVNFKSLETFAVNAQTENKVNTDYRRTSETENGFIDITVDIQTDAAYYITMPAHLTDENAKLFLDGKPLPYDNSFRSIQVYNIANDEAGKEKVFSIQLLEDHLNLRDVNVYTLDNNRVSAVMDTLRAQGLELTAFRQNHFSGQVTVTQPDQLLLMTIPYSEGWQARVNGAPATVIPVLEGGLSAVRIDEPGTYEITFSYTMPGLAAGAAISGLALILCLWLGIRNRHDCRKRSTSR